jgi:adenine specific DNA methylase Mod
LSANYKLNDRINNYKTNKTKSIKLQHLIESSITKNDNITSSILEAFVDEYDKIYEDLVFGFPNHIKNKVVKKYQGIKSLPNSLAFIATSDIVIISNNPSN